MAPRQTVEDWFPLHKPGEAVARGKGKGKHAAAAGEVKLALTFEPAVAPSIRTEGGAQPAAPRPSPPGEVKQRPSTASHTSACPVLQVPPRRAPTAKSCAT